MFKARRQKHQWEKSQNKTKRRQSLSNRRCLLSMNLEQSPFRRCIGILFHISHHTTLGCMDDID